MKLIIALSSQHFEMLKIYSICNGTETLSDLGPKIWSLVQHEIRQPVSFAEFKSNIKK